MRVGRPQHHLYASDLHGELRFGGGGRVHLPGIAGAICRGGGVQLLVGDYQSLYLRGQSGDGGQLGNSLCVKLNRQ